MYTYDTETHLIEPGCTAPKIVCLSCFNTENNELSLITNNGSVHFHEDGAPEFTDECIEQRAEIILKDEQILGHNTAFDMNVLRVNFPDLDEMVWDAYEESRVDDTMVRARLEAIALDRFDYDSRINVKPRFNLAELVRAYLGEDISATKKGEDVWRLNYHKLDGVPIHKWPQEAVRYALDDAVWPERVLGQMSRRPPDLDLQMRAAWMLQLISWRGLKTDQDRVEALRAKLQEEYDALKPILINHGILRPVMKGKKGAKYIDRYSKHMAHIRGLIEEELGVDAPLTKNKKNPQISTAAETLQMCSHPGLVALHDSGSCYKELTSFIPKLQPVVNAFFNVLVKTGRTSCSNPNLQQMPRREGVRECFMARDGFVFVVCDWSAAELCSLAEVCIERLGYSTLGDLINKGIDVHLWVAMHILRVKEENPVLTYEQVVERKKEKVVKDMRQLAKALNFGFPGGLGAKTFIEYAKGTWGIDWLTIDDAKRFKTLWMAQLPEMADYFRYMSNFPEKATILQHMSGRPRGGCIYTQRCNTLFQGLTADGKKAAGYEIARQCYRPGGSLNGSFLVNEVHDEYMLESPVDLAEKHGQILSDIMVTEMSKWVKRVKITTEWEVLGKYWRK